MNLYTVLSIFSIAVQCWCSPISTPKIQMQTEDAELNEAINSLNTATNLLNNDPTYLNLIKEVEKVIRNENQNVYPIDNIKQAGQELEYDTSKLIIKTPEQRKNVVNMYFPFGQEDQQQYTSGDIVRQLQQQLQQNHQQQSHDPFCSFPQQQENSLAEKIAEHQQQDIKMQQNSEKCSDCQEQQHQSKEDVANQKQVQQFKEEYVASHQQNDQQQNYQQQSQQPFFASPRQQKNFLDEKIAEHQQQENKMQQNKEKQQHQSKEDVATQEQIFPSPQQQKKFLDERIAEYQQQENKMPQNREEYLDGQEHQSKDDVANQEQIQQHKEEYGASQQQNDQQQNDQQQTYQQQSQQSVFASSQQQEKFLSEKMAEQQGNNLQANEQKLYCRLDCDNAETHKPICAINANNKYSVFENVCAMQLNNCLNPGIDWQPIPGDQCKNTIDGLFNILHKYSNLEDDMNKNIGNQLPTL